MLFNYLLWQKHLGSALVQLGGYRHHPASALKNLANFPASSAVLYQGFVFRGSSDFVVSMQSISDYNLSDMKAWKAGDSEYRGLLAT
jgi:hypothetical protein